MTNYQPVIGLEVHVELNTKSKMFCGCSADYFGKEPNTHTCPICLGLPGALPFINDEAIRKCLQIGLALNCQASEKSLFERKNYFYPDLPKGFQISQYRWPLCTNGKWKMENGKWLRINRVHQEEDTGKLTHVGNETLIDFNRSGVPLVEIVTEPDFTSSFEVKDYAKKLQQIFRYLGVSNADMERGDMRLEANISVRPEGSKRLPNYRVELKNINSFRFMVAAIEFEIKRQIEALERGEKLSQETKGWDEDKKCTYVQRSKEEAHDYRYFPEPDLPEIRNQRSDIGLVELPAQKMEKFQNLGLSKTQALILVDSKETAEYFEKAVSLGQEKNVNPLLIANQIINKKIDMSKVSASNLVNQIQSKGRGIISNQAELEKFVKQATEENPKAVEDYKKGKEAALQVLIGAVMKLSSGKADLTLVLEILKKILLNS